MLLLNDVISLGYLDYGLSFVAEYVEGEDSSVYELFDEEAPINKSSNQVGGNPYLTCVNLVRGNCHNSIVVSSNFGLGLVQNGSIGKFINKVTSEKNEKFTCGGSGDNNNQYFSYLYVYWRERLRDTTVYYGVRGGVFDSGSNEITIFSHNSLFFKKWERAKYSACDLFEKSLNSKYMQMLTYNTDSRSIYLKRSLISIESRRNHGISKCLLTSLK